MKLDTRITLAVEELMLHPQFADVIKHLHGKMPTALADQHGAANQHARDSARISAASNTPTP